MREDTVIHDHTSALQLKNLVESMDLCELQTRSIEVASWQNTTEATALPRSIHTAWQICNATPHSAKVFCPISRGLPRVPHKNP